MNYTEKGSKLYLFSIVLVAVIGGLLFGYDTAVISGADKGLQAFFMGASDFVYTDTIHGITSSFCRHWAPTTRNSFSSTMVFLPIPCSWHSISTVYWEESA